MRGAWTAKTGPLTPVPPRSLTALPPLLADAGGRAAPVLHRHLREAITDARRQGLGAVAIDLELELPDRGVVRGPIDERLDALLAQRQLLNEAVDRELLALKEAPAAQVEDPYRLGDVEDRMRPCDAQRGLPVGNPGLAAELHVTQDVAKRLRDGGAEPVAVTRGALQRLAGHDEPGLGQLSPVRRGAVGGADQVLGDDQACLRMLRGRGVEEVGGAGQPLVSGEQPLQPGQRGCAARSDASPRPSWRRGPRWPAARRPRRPRRRRARRCRRWRRCRLPGDESRARSATSAPTRRDRAPGSPLRSWPARVAAHAAVAATR